MSEPRILIWDLETLPNMTEAFKHWTGLSQYPGITFKSQLQSIICCGWKLFGKHEKVHCENAWDFKSWNKDVNDDYALCKHIRENVFTDDIAAIVTHNGKSFDLKVLQTRLLFHGLPLLPKIPHIDTKQVAKTNFSFFNNRLGNIGEFIANDKKMENGGWELWVKVMQRHAPSQKIMSDYCKQDVILLEKIFRKLRPLATAIPNHNHFTAGKQGVCPKCGSTRLQKRGIVYSATKAYRSYFCKDCGGWHRTDGADRNPR